MLWCVFMGIIEGVSDHYGVFQLRIHFLANLYREWVSGLKELDNTDFFQADYMSEEKSYSRYTRFWNCSFIYEAKHDLIGNDGTTIELWIVISKNLNASPSPLKDHSVCSGGALMEASKPSKYWKSTGRIGSMSNFSVRPVTMHKCVFKVSGLFWISL